MISSVPEVIRRILLYTGLLMLLLAAAMVLGLSMGSAGGDLAGFWQTLKGRAVDNTTEAIIWQIRLPRVLLAGLVGAALSLGGLSFQALLRNPLAEPYILGISGGSAIGAIIGILMGFSAFPGISLTSFIGSFLTLVSILMISSGRAMLIKDALLLSGVMVNAFCTAVILFLISMTQDARLHNIMFWLMGDLSTAGLPQIELLAVLLLPCFGVIFWLSHSMNLMQLGSDLAATMGIHTRMVAVTLLVIASLMISITVSHCGLIGFVGLVIPHLFRLLIGPDHRVLVPACILGGGSYMIICDVLARVLPDQGEMPAGVITAMIGAPLFIYLLKRSKRC